jgi:hypothetical protein
VRRVKSQYVAERFIVRHFEFPILRISNETGRCLSNEPAAVTAAATAVKEHAAPRD